jgi:hypothetical protein
MTLAQRRGTPLIPARLRRALTLTLACAVAAIAMAFAHSPNASAYTQDYCGVVVPSSFSFGYCNSSTASITYNRAQYTGGGTIDTLAAAIINNPGGGYRGGAYAASNAATFVSICFYSRASGYGSLYQHENSGASHTISGRVDDSLGHTSCLS